MQIQKILAKNPDLGEVVSPAECHEPGHPPDVESWALMKGLVDVMRPALTIPHPTQASRTARRHSRPNKITLEYPTYQDYTDCFSLVSPTDILPITPFSRLSCPYCPVSTNSSTAIAIS